MGAYSYSRKHKAFVKSCPKCSTTYAGTDNNASTIRILSEFFAEDKYTTDGFYGTCRTCVAKANQRRRQGRDDCEPEELLEKQKGKCAICAGDISLVRMAYTKTKAYVDHNHETGKVRGLLCHRCNGLLAAVEDREWLAKAVIYLKATDEDLSN